MNGGIARKTRESLARLHRELSNPFGVEEAQEVLDLPPAKTARLLAHLAAQGWLVRLRRGVYSTVPVDAKHPQEWHVHPWLIAQQVFTPCYIGGWTACEHWDLTEQIFNDVVVVSEQRNIRMRQQVIKDNRYLLKTLKPGSTFGTKPVWVERQRIWLSDPHRTIVDVLDDPSIGGGIRHVASVVINYFESEVRNDEQLLEYIDRRGNRTVYKRLGFVLEDQQVEAPMLIEKCRNEISAGYSVLDPAIDTRGRLVRRWNLRVNSRLAI